VREILPCNRLALNLRNLVSCIGQLAGKTSDRTGATLLKASWSISKGFGPVRIALDGLPAAIVARKRLPRRGAKGA
jgi:hypothetical protein